MFGAAFLINLLAFALPLFSMNVYDRIIPNRAVSSLWVLAIGVLLAFAVEFALRMARSNLLDELGRKLDLKLSEKIFGKLVNLPLSDRSGDTGRLVRRVSEFEIVRDFFASTTAVLIVDMLFLVVFVAMIAVLAGWLALGARGHHCDHVFCGQDIASQNDRRDARCAGRCRIAAQPAGRSDQRRGNAEIDRSRRPDHRAAGATLRG